VNIQNLKTAAAGSLCLVMALFMAPAGTTAAVAADDGNRGPAARSQTWQYIDQKAREAEEAAVRVLAAQPERKMAPPATAETLPRAPQAAVRPDNLFADIFFASDSHKIGFRDLERLRRQAEWLRENPEAKLTVAGYCDDRGNRKYNLALGMKRAAAVKDQLVRSGVAGQRITAVSYGKERLFDRRRTKVAQAVNRRVQLVVTPGISFGEGVVNASETK